MYTKDELLKIVGGSISGTLINAMVRGINALLDVGRSLGTSVRMIIDRRKC